MFEHGIDFALFQCHASAGSSLLGLGSGSGAAAGAMPGRAGMMRRGASGSLGALSPIDDLGYDGYGAAMMTRSVLGGTGHVGRLFVGL